MRFFNLSILSLLYILASMRYFPGDPGKTAVETLMHMLGVVPFTIGCTMLFVSFFQKMAKEKLPWDRVARIFFMLALLFELLFGIKDYIN